jgi:hypothetical protein
MGSPEDVDVIQLQDTDAGAVIHPVENGFCADGEQEAPWRRARRRSAAGCPSTPTAG